ncbi:MAG: tRNA (adenosine(37)-N6)-threonylcarbamoyltransferase complex ATPase subunit type 1 TsaE [Clostridia bacterium]|nr:tRNA (adenosine(37)-N6)-threonylcarbamoyltransferase complex ATPase subunit type 1 TsaE [Clostridia bacterium]
MISFENINENTLKRLGFCLGKSLRAGDVVLLRGEMGAGKSVLTRAAAEGMGVTGPVPSPTFTILNIHEGTALRLYHFDLYRLESADALWEMGLEEYIPSTDGVTFIEWPQMAEEAMPGSVLEIEIVYAMDGLARSLTMTGTGDFDMARLEALEGMLEELHEDSDD